MNRPAKCENCGYSSRHSRQQPGEKLLHCENCSAWLCAGCRTMRGCADHLTTETAVDGAPREVPPPNDGFYSAIPDTVYHADPDSLSSSGARELMRLTPAEFDYNRREPPNPKPQYDFGHAAHKMVLGEGSRLVKVDARDWRTKDAQIARNTAWKYGKVPLLKKDIDLAQRMAGKVFEHRLAARLLSRGAAEMSGYWHDDQTGIRCRFRPDWLTEPPGRIICVDYKSAVSADPKYFEKQVFDFGYHQEQAWYEDGLAEIGIEGVGFLFIVQQKTPPHLVSVCSIKPEIVELGRRQNRKAIELFAKHSEAGDWPGYGDGIHEVGLPPWGPSQIEAALEALDAA
jgi:PDDEXK-like domain of unknown function (DUF3799)